jgi:hypothetical protein
MKGGLSMCTEENDLELKPEGEATSDVTAEVNDNSENQELPLDAGEESAPPE